MVVQEILKRQRSADSYTELTKTPFVGKLTTLPENNIVKVITPKNGGLTKVCSDKILKLSTRI